VAHKLVIVESPAKARTIEGYLGKGYVVESSIGHIRDLPQTAADIPAKIKGEPWARLGVNVDDGFKPVYVVSRDKRAHINKLKALLKDADELYLATDEDREGEAIAWHLLDELKPPANLPVHRMVFHEITPAAIQAAVASPRQIDMDLVEAQEARRILDRLYGYEVSPVLWKKVMSGLSAGRVQSVATRLVVDRERERIAFRLASYWDLEGTFDAGAEHEQRMFPGKLHSIDGVRVARGTDFGDDGALKSDKVVHVNQARAELLVESLHDSSFTVRSVESKPYTRKPYAPFRTTTLQQEASRKLGFSASSTMSVAQRLYENGYITYMRTDSTTLSDTALNAARSQARELYGLEYVPDAPRVYASKVKNAQEAHEAIRPAGDNFRTPAQTGLTGDQFRLYELIWMRTIASQMKDAAGNSLTIRLGGPSADGEDVIFSSSGRTITFHGFLKAYVEGNDDAEAASDDAESKLPNLTEGASVNAASLKASGHETKPPARYTEASLISELEKREIGRPSTYAAIIGTILNRGYVYKKGTALVPAWLAFSVIRLLEGHFERLVDYEFTALLEGVLDDIAGGRKDLETELAEFYFGSERVEGLKRLVTELGEIDAKELATFPVLTLAGEPSGIDLRVGRYGPYVERAVIAGEGGEDGEGDGVPARANVPDDLPPDELTEAKALELLANPAGVEQELGKDPESVRHRDPSRRCPEEAEGPDRLAVQDDDARDGQPR
jgi:DNA topoisomerase-1